MNLNAQIIPGRSAADLVVGASAKELVRSARLERAGELGTDGIYRDGPVRVWVVGGRIRQVGVGEGYSGQLVGTRLSVGSSIAEVERQFGEVVEDAEDKLVVKGSAGWCFETEEWNGHELSENRGARITEIFVFSEEW